MVDIPQILYLYTLRTPSLRRSDAFYLEFDKFSSHRLLIQANYLLLTSAYGEH